MKIFVFAIVCTLGTIGGATIVAPPIGALMAGLLAVVHGALLKSALDDFPYWYTRRQKFAALWEYLKEN